MTRSRELSERSPLRIFERSLHGGLGAGELGVVCSSPGVGKSAFLVGVALDHLLRGEEVLHIAQDQPLDRIEDYYAEIFAELVRHENLEDADEARQRIARKRHIQSYQGGSFSVASLEQTLHLLRQQAGLRPALMILDGYHWARGSEEELARLKRIAAGMGTPLWMSARTPRGWQRSPSETYPQVLAPYVELLDVLVQLRTADGTVHLELLKDRAHPHPEPPAVELDPTTLLLMVRG